MGYVTQKGLVDCRNRISQLTKRGDTFLGLLLYCINIKEWLIPQRHAKADMKEFSLLADKAFGVVEPDTKYSEKEWYALLSKSWLDDIRIAYLNGKKIPALDTCITVFWWMEFDSTEQAISFFKKQFPADIYNAFFYDEENSTLDFSSPTPCARKDLLKLYGGNHEHKALKLGGDLIKKKAGELSGAPFAQTLYAASEIKHIVNITDFDVFENFELSLGTKPSKAISLSSSSSDIEATISKPFLLLAGISGTGKTRFVRKQAEKTGSIEDTYCLTSVRPDWHEPSDLLGYTSRLSGNAEYIVTDVLKFIVKAWIAIKKAGIILQGKEAFGEKNQQQHIKPYWLCLDEMNLAPVEQYFADYLSVLETREWAWQGNDFSYQCDPLLKATVFEAVDKDKLKGELGLVDHDELWDHFVANGIGIPFNLIVAGTVNMDETTHGFSRKVIDRALTFDFGEFFPNDFDAFFDAKSEPKALSYPLLTDGRNKAKLNGTFDNEGILSIAFLKQINGILGNTPFKLAYRALNELFLAVITQNPKDEIELQSVWDDFLMCKVLPRIEGDIDKLTKGDSDNSILDQLSVLLSEQLKDIWATKSRQDLFRKSLEDDPLITIECRSKAKIEWMSDQLKNGFTSFWP
ncbi:5-methylcytosine-specific restriction enzyme B [Vibrio crassostreae]|uniref:McrB family protein n=1 Tax=Vibrio cyclitrophicus TaxID=47951 RepID=UPI0002E1A496|nr:hypothetical protein [Vibrio cyclitrophicus]CAK2217769.1 5-methylcytosine-specific restriction enzyme B [Vibrio crassostreae]OEF61886.1 hypothetical protein OAA_19170 [Vibrio cyclitrophicus 1F175]PMI06500.1 hypothetical protein BCU52_17405 [Vibrio cyclitrophicus]CAK2384011.1 5-methylcytosine-specific restriction enzyme B [Vibrio crassostreae]CAK2553928.1 5-methylcytosine-specific restriction enzyme B [Vibrio crassostreae]